jgi:Asp-tRNA(Asn)/Glu-tRNA(Gln) amidotransferase C subunit
MPDLNKADIYELARTAELELDDARVETIASRLSGVLTGLDEIPTEKLMSVEPALTYSVKKEGGNG